MSAPTIYVYKCRMCHVVHNRQFAMPEVNEYSPKQVLDLVCTNPLGALVPIWSAHPCADGQVGIADLMGAHKARNGT